MVGADPAWLLHATGIEQRRFAGPGETVATLGIAAAKDCLSAAGIAAADVGFVIVSSGSAEKRFPGPASTIAAAAGMAGKPAIDLPMASAGGLFGIALAAQLASLGKTWRDQEQKKFAEEFQQHMKVLARFVDVVDRHVPYLMRKADIIEEYLQQR